MTQSLPVDISIYPSDRSVALSVYVYVNDEFRWQLTLNFLHRDAPATRCKHTRRKRRIICFKNFSFIVEHVNFYSKNYKQSIRCNCITFFLFVLCRIARLFDLSLLLHEPCMKNWKIFFVFLCFLNFFCQLDEVAETNRLFN